MTIWPGAGAGAGRRIGNALLEVLFRRVYFVSLLALGFHIAVNALRGV